MASVAEEPPQASVVTLRSIYVSSPATDAESQSIAASGGGDNNNDVVSQHRDVKSDGSNREEEDGDAKDPIQLPQSTHSLLFSAPVVSLPFAFAISILGISIACLALAFANSLTTNEIPVNVSWSVRGAQYLSILFTLLMEEEIPTGLYLIRMITKQSLKQKFPQMKYKKFIISSIVRILLGYIFLLNVLLVLVQATGVLEIFYDVLALQFIESLDDIAFKLCKMDVLGKTLQRACTSKCFRAEFDGRRLGRSRNLSIFLKTIYFFNLCGMLSGMAYVSTRQIRGDLHDPSITINFGNNVWASSWVKVPLWLYELYQALPGQEYEELTLVYAYFNGVYVKNGTQYGRPMYMEMRKSDNTPFNVVEPAVVKYCDEINAWVFTHDNISRKKSGAKDGCNWLLRSPETDEYDLLNVVGQWQVWVGVIGHTEVTISSNTCGSNSDCNLNGKCLKDGKCKCDNVDGVQYLGTHCEVELKDRCRTITGERDGSDIYSVFDWSFVSDKREGVFQQYSRPMYHTFSEGKGGYDDHYIFMIYSGNRWFGFTYAAEQASHYTEEEAVVFWSDYHAFWYRAHSAFTFFVSDPSEGSTPVGVDFYVVGEQGEQYGPFGALYPAQLNNQTGRGYFRCIDSEFEPDNAFYYTLNTSTRS